MKITGAADRPQQLIRRFKNERMPSVAVTVDLLTTGIDVPEITNLVFVRRVNSRILFEQMLGRATRRCDEIDKQTFRVFDAVRLFEALAAVNTMRPVVVDPNFTFADLVDHLLAAEDEPAREGVRDQIRARLQRTRRHGHLLSLAPRADFRLQGRNAAHVNSFELGQHGRYRTNVWQYRGVNTLKSGRMDELAMHPPVKPVQMIADAIKDVAGRGEIVLDLFGGSGSTLIAAEKTGRRALLAELDPIYSDRILARWEQFAKDDAERLLQGAGTAPPELEARA